MGIRKDRTIGHITGRAGRNDQVEQPGCSPMAQSFKSGVQGRKKQEAERGCGLAPMQSLPTSQGCPHCLWQCWGKSPGYKDTQLLAFGEQQVEGTSQGWWWPAFLLRLYGESWPLLGSFSHGFHFLCTTTHFFGIIQHMTINHCCSFLFRRSRSYPLAFPA